MVLTDDQVVSLFGDPTPYMTTDGGILAAAWESRILTPVALPAPLHVAGGGQTKVIRCHRLIAPSIARALDDLYAKGNWLLLQDYGGCYCWRTQRLAAHARSRHSWGIAIDLNVHDNPMMGTPKMAPEVVLAFKLAGFAWGGDFVHRPDGMHFEFYDVTKLAVPA